MYFASQERFKRQLFTLFINPRQASADKVQIVNEEKSTENGTKTVNGNNAIEFDNVGVKNGSANKDNAQNDSPKYLILDCSAVSYIDLSGLDTLGLVVVQYAKVGIEVWLAGVPKRTLDTMRRGGVVGEKGKVTEDKVFFSVMDAVQAARLALGQRIVVHV